MQRNQSKVPVLMKSIALFSAKTIYFDLVCIKSKNIFCGEKKEFEPPGFTKIAIKSLFYEYKHKGGTLGVAQLR